MTQQAKNGGVVALFGSAGEIGRALLIRLASDSQWKRIVCFDMLAPRRHFAHSVFYKVDLTEPSIHHTLLQIFEKEKIDTVVHAAFEGYPIPDQEYLHDYECIGTLQILAACSQMNIHKLIVQGTTLTYGAAPDNPMYLSEEQPLRADKAYDFLREKIDVENQVAAFAKNHKKTCVTQFRLAVLMGKGADNFMNDYLTNPAVQTVLGYDPLWQVLHIEDALDVFGRTLTKDIPGVFNYAAPGVLPLSTIIKLLEGARIPVPSPWLRVQAGALRLAKISSFPPQHLEYLKFGCLADCTRAFKVLGLRPKYSIHETLADSLEKSSLWED